MGDMGGELTIVKRNNYNRHPTMKETEMQTTSAYLYASPSFSEGVARILDFGNTLGEYNTPGDLDPDCVALWMDWAAIGDDFHSAVGKFTTEESDKLAVAQANR